MQTIAEPDNANPNILFDYITTAAWAGEYQTAVQVYETRMQMRYKDIPAYVKINVAGAYYQLKKYQEAGQIYHEVAIGGDKKARLWEAESLSQMGKNTEASQIFEELLRDAPDNADIYLSRANMNLLRGDYISAAKDVDTVIGLWAQQNEDNSSRLQIRAEMAARFIRDQEYEHAILLLKPAIEDGSATIHMQCDYVLALFLHGDYKIAVAEGVRLWPDYGTVPLYGRRALADSYLRLKVPAKAIPIYRTILEEEGKLASDKQSLAYACVLNGDTKNGFALYGELIESGAEQAVHVSFDGNALLGLGRYDAGKRLYQMVLDKYPDNIIVRQRFAGDLYAAGLIREAHEQYAILNTLPESQPVAAAGVVNTAVMVGDYAAARPAVNYLRNLFDANPAVGQALGRFDRRFMGGVNISFSTIKDYKGNDVHVSQIVGEQRINDHFLVLGGRGHAKISDNDSSSSLTTLSVGGRYVGMQDTVELWLDQNRYNGNFFGYRFNLTHYFGEDTNLNLAVNRTPLADAQALDERIMSREYRLTLNRQIGLKDTFSLGVAKAFFSDDNNAKALNASWTHAMIDNDQRRLEWFTYFGRTDYDLQLINGVEPVYESPSTREAAGIGITSRWIYPKHYWEGVLALEWGRDRPEPVDFSPYTRLEYGHTFSPWQALVLGAEYGWRTGRSTNTGHDLQFNYRQFDVSYRVSW